MIDLFFEESHENIKNACTIAFQEILDNCFVNMKTKQGEKAACSIFHPLLNVINNGVNQQQRWFASNILRKLNLHYKGNQDVIDNDHIQELVNLGMNKKVYDNDYLMTINDLIYTYGITNVLGKNTVKAIPYMVNSLVFNQTGRNAIGKVQRDANVSASLSILEGVAENL